MHSLVRNPMFAAAAAAALLAPRPGRAAEYFVPAVQPTIQAAVAAAEGSGDLENTIWLTDSPITTGAPIRLDNSFDPGRHLLIRPTASLGRAMIVNNGFGHILEMAGASNVTIQDVDLLRATTNTDHLVYLHYELGFFVNDVVIERCRIGSIWNSTGVADRAYLRTVNVLGVTVRNCILFALVPGTVDRGIHATDFVDGGARLRLYNNVVADYGLAGIRVDDGVGAIGSMVVLRNNVTVNHPSLGLAPIGYVSFVDDATAVLTSHNTTFSPAGRGAFVGAGAIDIAGVATGTVIRLAPADAPHAFVQVAWNPVPALDPNPALWHLKPDGLLHDDGAADHGVTVTEVFPDAEDVPVNDDIDRESRPGPATDPHTDRGADQVDPSVLAVEPILSASRVLEARLERNPAPAVAVRYRAQRAGRLEWTVFDLAGRSLHHEARAVEAGETGRFRAPGAAGGRIVFYRLSLVDGSGVVHAVRGQAVQLR